MDISAVTSQFSTPRTTAPDMVTRALREAVLQGLLPAGQSLRQDDLAASFGVSRIPIREALRRLEAEGLVTIRPHRGAIVTELTAEEAQELFEMRIALEKLALEKSIPNLTPAWVTQTRSILTELDRTRDVTRSGELNRKFHAALYQPAGRPRLMIHLADLHRKFDRYMILLVKEMGYQERSQAEHHALFHAWENNNTARAAAMLEQHIETAGLRLMKYLQASPELT